MFKYGIKLWSANKEWFKEAVKVTKEGKVDFVEIYLVPDSFSLADFEILKKNNIPITLHAPHTTHNFNLFNLTEKSLDIWQNQILKTADYLQSQFIVVHPGTGDSKEIFKQESAKIKDPRVLMENMPQKGFIEQTGGVICFGYSKEQLEFIRQECGFEICFDVCHAVASVAFQKIDAKEFICDCIKTFEPHYFHISGGNIGDEIDKHLNVWESNFDFSWLKKKLADIASNKDLDLVFETPKTGKGLENDIKNINYFKNILSF